MGEVSDFVQDDTSSLRAVAASLHLSDDGAVAKMGHPALWCSSCSWWDGSALEVEDEVGGGGELVYVGAVVVGGTVPGVVEADLGA